MDQVQHLEDIEKRYDKLGGWLILVAINVILTPFVLLVRTLPDIWMIFTPESWHSLTTPGSEVYHPLYAPVLIFELAGNLALFVLSIIYAIYFFHRDKAVPKMTVIFMGSNLVFINIVFFVAYSIPTIRAEYGAIKKGLIQALISCLIWIPYFLRSKRVKRTFVH